MSGGNERKSDSVQDSSNDWPRTVSADSVPPRCPRCERVDIRKRHRWASISIGVASFLLVGITALTAFLLCAHLFSHVQWRGGLRLLSIGAASVITLTLAGGWTTILAQYRCQACGRRFGSDHPSVHRNRERPFPTRFFILTAIVLLAGFSASQETLHLLSRGAVSILVFNALLVCLGAAVLAGLIALYQVLVVHWVFRKRAVTGLLWAGLLLWPAIALAHFPLYETFPVVVARIILSTAELSSLPKSAHQIKAYHWSSPFSGAEFARFTAEPEDIERFLKQSPALQNKEPDRHPVEFPKGMNPPHPYEVNVSPTAPDWYRQTFIEPGRRYHIQPPDYHCPGEVFVDDKNHIVYVYISFS